MKRQFIQLRTLGVGRSFRLFAALLPLLGACAVSTQQEVELGTKYAGQISKELPLVQDPELVRYINVLGDSLAHVTDSRNLDWHFYIVDSKDVNAFAIPGGYVYVNRGLIERAQTMSQVAGVIGHEIGHVTRRHSIKQMQKSQGMNIGGVLLCTLTSACSTGLAQAGIGVASNGLFAKFSRGDEAEADQEGVKTVIAAGIDPNGFPELFRILLDERKAKPGSLDTFFASHPMEEDRITATETLIATYPAISLKGLTVNTPNFQAFKARLKELPPPIK
jgi:predicted Zn-dependent protease